MLLRVICISSFRLAAPQSALKHLLAVARVGQVEVDAGANDLVDRSIVRGPTIADVTAGWLTTKAIASSITDRPAPSATLASFATASSLRWFSGSDMSKRAASRRRAGEGGELSALQRPDRQPPPSGL